MTEWPVLQAVEAASGTPLDEGCGRVFALARERLGQPGVRRVFLADGLVERADAPLALECPGTIWVEWRGGSGGDMLAAKPGASAAALFEPIGKGFCAGGCSVSFWAGLGEALLPIPGRVIVTSHRGPGLSPIDATRAAACVETAEEATAGQLRRMDEAVSRFVTGYVYLRCVPDADTTPVGVSATSDGWRTWSDGDLRRALANTAVELDHNAGLLAPERPEAVRRAAAPFATLLLYYGPRAALRLLSTLSIRLM